MSKFDLIFFAAGQQDNHSGSGTKELHKMVMFYWKLQLESDVCYLATVYPSVPLSDSHLASGLDTRASDWTA